MPERRDTVEVSVIIPCRDVREHVSRAVESAMKQSGVVTEVIVIDDGSTDGTLDVLRGLVERHATGMKLIELTGAGACAARNAGLRDASGVFVQFLDADDTLRPDKLQRQLALARGAQADVVVGGYVNHYQSEQSDEVVMPLQDDAWQALIRTRMGTTSANLFRRESVLEAGAWDERLRSSQDYELLFRMLKGGARIAWDMQVACDVLKREHGSISKTGERENWLRYIELRRAMRDHARTLDPGIGRAAADAADQYLFMAIRVLSAHDRSAALEAHDRLMPSGFRPEPGPATSRSYVLVYNLLGFRAAERLWTIKEALKGR